jgi:aspartokinase
MEKIVEVRNDIGLMSNGDDIRCLVNLVGENVMNTEMLLAAVLANLAEESIDVGKLSASTSSIYQALDRSPGFAGGCTTINIGKKKQKKDRRNVTH